MIIDDDSGTIETYSRVLRLAGFETAAAPTGLAGIAIARTFDVILVGLCLPDFSGIDVVRELRRSGIAAPTVILTMFPTLDSAFDASSVGADGYIEGPLRGNQIVEVVVQSLSETRPIRHPARPPNEIEPSARARERALSARIQVVKQVIEEELDQSYSVGTLAARVGCSESTLSHRFHIEVGVTIPEYRRERRLQQTAELLVTTLLPLRQVAQRVGYKSFSLADFRRDFRERFDMSPKDYRGRYWRRPAAAQ